MNDDKELTKTIDRAQKAAVNLHKVQQQQAAYVKHLDDLIARMEKMSPREFVAWMAKQKKKGAFLEEKEKMNEDKIREAVRQALQAIGNSKIDKVKESTKSDEDIVEETEEAFVPREKEHLQENKNRLNNELMRRWGFKKKEKLNG